MTKKRNFHTIGNCFLELQKDGMQDKKLLKIALVCGGSSQERGISLNSARCFLDHVQPLQIDLSLFYLHPTGVFYRLSPTELYSNTPSDFDFKIQEKAEGFSTTEEWIEKLKEMDLVFPLIHGSYGEDGTLQALLESKKIPFVGSSSRASFQMFHKYKALELLKAHNFNTLPTLHILSPDAKIESFWHAHELKKAVIKPCLSGSSIGVRMVFSLEEAQKTIGRLWEEGFSDLLLEPYSEGIEFTICVLGAKGSPVALIPLEIDIQKQGIFDYRKKYLPTATTRCYCPPRFSKALIEEIRKSAEKLFCLFEVKDFVRIDGWIEKDGSIRFSDFNPLSGMEQNSFLFQQAARVGLSHTDLLEHVMNEALFRYQKSSLCRKPPSQEEKKPVFILMGGNTSERQVSLLSGSNVWLKLLQSCRYKPIPFLLDTKRKLWQLPYDFALHHTVEEMMQHCREAKKAIKTISPLIEYIRKKLGLFIFDVREYPKPMSLAAFLDQARANKAFIFLALHGGIGENGTLQKRLEKEKILFNGSLSFASKLCMDKRKTSETIKKLQNPSILPMPQIAFRAFKQVPQDFWHALWEKASKKFQTKDLIIKPQKDGCSTGVVRLCSQDELICYMNFYLSEKAQIPGGFFVHHPLPIEMPYQKSNYFLLEPFIQTDKIYLSQTETELQYQKISGWCEMTIGILEKGGIYHAFNPSLTLSTHHVLSVEEKFQGGTGINITPPPEFILPNAAKIQVQKNACEIGRVLHIKGYARLDLFVDCDTGSVRVIEANTLPALSPSTVLYQQALAEPSPLTPLELLTHLINCP